MAYAITYTTAPRSFDGMETTTMAGRVGMYKGDSVRMVRTPLGFIAEQRQSYRSGKYLSLNQDDWYKLVEEGEAEGFRILEEFEPR